MYVRSGYVRVQYIMVVSKTISCVVNIVLGSITGGQGKLVFRDIVTVLSR